MIALASILGYIVLGLVTGRIIFFKFLEGDTSGEDDIFFVLMGSLLWPFCVLVATVYFIGITTLKIITAPTPKLPKKKAKSIEQTPEINADTVAYIRKLERDNEMRAAECECDDPHLGTSCPDDPINQRIRNRIKNSERIKSSVNYSDYL